MLRQKTYEWSEWHINIGKSDEHGSVDRTVTLVDCAGWLVSVSSVRASRDEWCVGEVKLCCPCDECWCTCDRANRSHIAVVWTDSLARSVPGQVDELSWERKRLRSVVSDGWSTSVTSNVQVLAALVLWEGGDGRIGSAVASTLVGSSVVWRKAVNIGLVHDVQSWEVLPRKTSGVLRATGDVGSKVCPCPGLWNTSLEPYGLKPSQQCPCV